MIQINVQEITKDGQMHIAEVEKECILEEAID